MKRKRLTIYHTDGTEEIILSKAFEDGDGCFQGGITGIGYSIYDENDSQIIVQPTLHKKIKIETIDVVNEMGVPN